MKILIKLSRYALCALLIIVLVSCSTKSSNEPKKEGGIAPTSKFAKISVGMSPKQVRDLIGSPTDQSMYRTGKLYIPFYFGKDTLRYSYLYKGEGQIIFVKGGTVFGGSSDYLVDQIIYDPSETGYNK